MTMWKIPAGVAAINLHGRGMPMPRLGIELIVNSAGKPACVSRLTVAVVANRPAQKGTGT